MALVIAKSAGQTNGISDLLFPYRGLGKRNAGQFEIDLPVEEPHRSDYWPQARVNWVNHCSLKADVRNVDPENGVFFRALAASPKRRKQCLIASYKLSAKDNYIYNTIKRKINILDGLRHIDRPAYTSFGLAGNAVYQELESKKRVRISIIAAHKSATHKLRATISARHRDYEIHQNVLLACKTPLQHFENMNTFRDMAAEAAKNVDALNRHLLEKMHSVYYKLVSLQPSSTYYSQGTIAFPQQAAPIDTNASQPTLPVDTGMDTTSELSPSLQGVECLSLQPVSNNSSASTSQAAPTISQTISTDEDVEMSPPVGISRSSAPKCPAPARANTAISFVMRAPLASVEAVKVSPPASTSRLSAPKCPAPAGANSGTSFVLRSTFAASTETSVPVNISRLSAPKCPAPPRANSGTSFVMGPALAPELVSSPVRPVLLSSPASQPAPASTTVGTAVSSRREFISGDASSDVSAALREMAISPARATRTSTVAESSEGGSEGESVQALSTPVPPRRDFASPSESVPATSTPRPIDIAPSTSVTDSSTYVMPPPQSRLSSSRLSLRRRSMPLTGASPTPSVKDIGKDGGVQHKPSFKNAVTKKPVVSTARARAAESLDLSSLPSTSPTRRSGRSPVRRAAGTSSTRRRETGRDTLRTPPSPPSLASSPSPSLSPLGPPTPTLFEPTFLSQCKSGVEQSKEDASAAEECLFFIDSTPDEMIATSVAFDKLFDSE